MRHISSVIALAAVLLLALGVVGETLDDSPEVVSLYSRAKRLLREGNYLQAARSFEELAGRFPESPNHDLFLFNRGKAEYHFGDYDKALAAFSNFSDQYASSPMAAHALYFEGNIHYIKGRLSRAFGAYVEAYGRSSDPRLDELLEESITGAVEGASSASLAPDDFDAVNQPKKCQIMTSVATVLLSKGEQETAQSLLEACGERVEFDSTKVADRPSRGGLELALVLPFSGELQTFGEDIYNGAVIAAELYRQETGQEVQISPYDTKGDPVAAARIVRELASTHTDAVIGPLTSEEAAVAAAALSCETLPLIAPAATQAGLTQLGETAFQLSPNLELQAVLMADYAVGTLGADSAVVITSTSRDHLTMARVFADRFADLGGTIVAIEYYRPRDTDFGPYIKDIKATLQGAISDSAYYINTDGDTLNIDAVSASVDCLYLPGSPDQLRLLLPQIHFYNLNGAYLGSDGWGDNAVYRLGDAITKSAVFPSPFLGFATGEEYDRLARTYDARYGESPKRLAALGYDAVRLITMSADRSTDRDELVRRLSDALFYQGAAAPVSFGAHRENVELPMYRVQNGGAIPLGVAEPAADSTGQ